MNYELIPGKVALVTGSSRGLGRAIAEWMAIGGADVMLHDVSPSEAARYGEVPGPEAVLGEIERHGRRVDIAYGDLTGREAADELVRAAISRFGRVDVLVNCAGGDIGAAGVKAVPNECVEIPEEDLHVIMDRNLLTVMNVSRAASPHMIERGDGSIINIASVAGQVACPQGSIYAVAKAGVIHWTRCLAAQLRPHGINVNAIAPGDTVTGRFLASRYVAPERLADQGRLTRLGHPDDIGKACLFLASDLAAYISGQTIAVHGGGKY